MCDICKQYPCHYRCPNHKHNKIGVCENCTNELYEEFVIWTDSNRNKFCSKECAIDYYGIKEID